MLVIVNPYATTMSDRLKSLVVYALQGRYDVHAVDTKAKGHAIELCREAAHEGYDVVVAFGGDGTVNEAANGLAGSATPLTCLPGGATNVYCRMLGIPADVVDATEHLLGLADDWRAAPRRPRPARRPALHLLGRHGPRRQRRRARRPQPAPEGALRAVVLRAVRDPHVPRGATSCARRGSRSRSTARRSAASARSSRTATRTRTSSSRPIHVAGRLRARLGRLLGRRADAREPDRHPDRHVPRALQARARSRATGASTAFSGVHEVRVRSLDGRPVPVQVDGDHISDEVEVRFTVEPKALRIVS